MSSSGGVLYRESDGARVRWRPGRRAPCVLMFARADRTEKAERAERTERAARTEKTERAARTERTARADRTERAQKAEEAGKRV